MKLSKLFSQYDLILALWRQVYEDWEAHDKDWTLPGFRAVAVYRFGNWLTNRSGGRLQSFLLLLYRFAQRFIRNHYGIELYETTKLGRRFVVRHQSGIVIHFNAEFGDDCSVRQNVTVGAGGLDRLNEAPKFGHRVEVGAGAVIIGKITIGDGARIGPNTVVMTNVPAGATVVAEAPRIIQMRKTQQNGKEETDVRPRMQTA